MTLLSATAVSQTIKESAEHQYAQQKLDELQIPVDDFNTNAAEWFKTHSLARRLGNVGYKLRKEYEQNHIEDFEKVLPMLQARVLHVDACVVVYNQTVDLKVSDLTTRNTDQLKAFKSMDLYPPSK